MVAAGVLTAVVLLSLQTQPNCHQKKQAIVSQRNPMATTVEFLPNVAGATRGLTWLEASTTMESGCAGIASHAMQNNYALAGKGARVEAQFVSFRARDAHAFWANIELKG